MEKGYQPNAAAATLAHFRRASHSRPVQAALAWLNFRPDPAEMFQYREFALYWKGAAACAEKHGYHLEEFLGRDYRSIKRLESVLLARGIEGIVIPPHGVTPEWGDFDWSRFSIVRFGRTAEKPRTHVVTSDQSANALLALNEIRRRGYERVGLVVGRPNMIAGASWTGGFLQAQQFIEEKSRLPIFAMNGDLAASQRQLAHWIKKHRPDAIFTDLKDVASMLQNLGMRVPEDMGLAVTSVLDAGAGAGIYQNSEEIGRAAVLTLLSLIKDLQIVGVPSLPIPATVREAIETAWFESRALRIVYTKTSGHSSPRLVRIRNLVFDRSETLLNCVDLETGNDRQFRLDRVMQAQVMDSNPS